MTNPSGRAGVVAAYAGMCLIWGTTWLGIKYSLQYVPPITGAGLRFVVAGLFLYAVAAVRRPTGAVPWRLVFVLATCLFGFNYILTYVAESRLDSGLVAVLFGTLPFFLFGFGHFVAGERTTPQTWIGAAIALAGVAAISFGGQVRGSPLYAAAAIGSAAIAAFANVYAKRHSHHDPLVTLPPAMLFAGIGVTIAGIAFERPALQPAIAPQSIAALLYLALFGSSIAFFLNLWVLHRVAAWIVGLSALIIPVIAVAVGILFGGEHFEWRELAGSALVVAGIWVALTTTSQPPPEFLE